MTGTTTTTTTSTDAPATFDAAAYKATTTAQWQAAAAAWHGWGPVIEAWLGDATEAMLDLARLASGSLVLDVAAGAGGQSIAAARRVGRQGRVLATDISANLLDYADHAARMVGLSDVIATRVMDGEALEVQDERFDAAISRVGLIYLPNRQEALAGIRRALRPGGRIAVVTYSTPAANRFFSIPVSVIRAEAGLPTPPPGLPGPFCLSTPEALSRELVDAGFTEVEVRAVPSPLHLPTAADCVLFERESFGALHQMMAGLDPVASERTWTRVAEELAAFEGPDGFVGPCEMLVAGATNPGAQP